MKISNDLIKCQLTVAIIAPVTGPTQYTQWCAHDHETAAGPNERAGFIEPPDMGLPIKIPKQTVDPIAIPEI